VNVEGGAALRAWVAFRMFVDRERIDPDALDDGTLRALFDRFVALNEERTAALDRAVPAPPARIDLPAEPADPALTEQVEARFLALEGELARGLGAKQ
jgi:hypothetical protein